MEPSQETIPPTENRKNIVRLLLNSMEHYKFEKEVKKDMDEFKTETTDNFEVCVITDLGFDASTVDDAIVMTTVGPIWSGLLLGEPVIYEDGYAQIPDWLKEVLEEFGFDFENNVYDITKTKSALSQKDTSEFVNDVFEIDTPSVETDTMLLTAERARELSDRAKQDSSKSVMDYVKGTVMPAIREAAKNGESEYNDKLTTEMEGLMAELKRLMKTLSFTCEFYSHNGNTYMSVMW